MAKVNRMRTVSCPHPAIATLATPCPQNDPFGVSTVEEEIPATGPVRTAASSRYFGAPLMRTPSS